VPIYKSLSRSGVGEETAYYEFKEHSLPFSVAQKSSKFWGFVVRGGTPYGILTNMLTGAMNIAETNNMSPAIDVNRQALNWIKEMLDYPQARTLATMVCALAYAHIFG